MHPVAYDRLWPKADIETESKTVFVNVCFGEKSGRSDPLTHQGLQVRRRPEHRLGTLLPDDKKTT